MKCPYCGAECEGQLAYHNHLDHICQGLAEDTRVDNLLSEVADFTEDEHNDLFAGGPDIPVDPDFGGGGGFSGGGGGSDW